MYCTLTANVHNFICTCGLIFVNLSQNSKIQLLKTIFKYIIQYLYHILHNFGHIYGHFTLFPKGYNTGCACVHACMLWLIGQGFLPRCPEILYLYRSTRIQFKTFILILNTIVFQWYIIHGVKHKKNRQNYSGSWRNILKYGKLKYQFQCQLNYQLQYQLKIS